MINKVSRNQMRVMRHSRVRSKIVGRRKNYDKERIT